MIELLINVICAMDQNKVKSFINNFWEEKAIPGLEAFIKIPNKSPEFDDDWERNGHMDNAVQSIIDWCNNNKIKNMSYKIIKDKGRTPLILINIPGDIKKNILIYGHIDKQPEMTGWDDDLGPYQPKIKNGNLYGRGAVDDGYAIFSAFSSIKAIEKQNLSYPNIQIMLEASEESGSIDLPFYMEKYAPEIKLPDLVICLDSGCADYERLWLTSSLRGMLAGNITIKVLQEGVHSGMAGGIVPSASNILMRQLLKISDTDNILTLPEFKANIPKERIAQINETAKILGDKVFKDFPFSQKTKPLTEDNKQLIINQTWLNSYEIIGIDGIPNTVDAGNVHIPKITAKISFRLPPTCNANNAAEAIKNELEKNTPQNSLVEFTPITSNNGWHSQIEDESITKLYNKASLNYFGKECAFMGEGGSIPIINMLSEKFPQAKLLVTGVLGPDGNAHGPNEFLRIDKVVKFSCCLAEIIHKFFQD
ncbi:MAG: M20/M25/M40 family metallo-hydrolase [Pseudomonadota bacterium]|nr:M20/M25/M40 family metallo-hydrolase [Pseudomonadota bacterium]